MARYTLIVGTRNWSSWSLRPYMALKATGAPFDVVDIRLRQSEAPTTREQILKHSPAGKVPVLKVEEAGKARGDQQARAPLFCQPGFGILGQHGVQRSGVFGVVCQAGMHKSLLRLAVRDFMNRSS